MWPLTFNEISDVALVVVLLAVTGYAFWLRSKMEKSKASFALSLIGAITVLTALFLKAITGSETSTFGRLLFSVVDKETGWSLSPEKAPALGGTVTVALVVMYLFVIYFSYKIGQLTIQRWEGPTTLIVNDLAKNDNDNDIRLLAFAELTRLLARKPDPLASEVVVNWRQKISDPPGRQPWHLFIRQIFSVAFSETEIRDSGWRDQWSVWVGKIYISRQSATDSTPLLIFLFEIEPSHDKLNDRIAAYIADGASIERAKIYAVYYSKGDKFSDNTNHLRYQVVVMSQDSLLKRGLKLNTYARDLLQRFNNDRLGGTSATLKDTFVEPHVQRRGDPRDSSFAGPL